MFIRRCFSTTIFLFAYVILILKPALCQTPIEITTPMSPTPWSLLERRLLIENTRFAEAFAEKYINPVNGYFECEEHWGGSDGPDDIMENMYNWPLMYMLGAPQSTLDLFKFIWEGHIKQYSELGMFYKEFITSFDWEHNGEGYAAFELLPLSDPEDRLTQERIIRFANFYTGRDTTTHNYDPEHKIIRSIHNGSKGPRLTATTEDWSDRENIPIFNDHDWTQVQGDVPMNLHATTLVLNAYALTGDRHYKDWVFEYTGAWLDRTRKNNWNIPSIVGLNGKVGEGWDGKSYGGLMGWDWVFGGWFILGRGMRIGFNNAYFLSHDNNYINALRKQGENLLKNRVKKDNKWHFLNKFGGDGWYEEIPVARGRSSIFEALFAEIYYWTLDKNDLESFFDACQLDETRRRTESIQIYEYEKRFEGGNEILWFDFLNGDYPDYPTKALTEAIERNRIKTESLRKDTTTPDTRRADTPVRAGIVGVSTGALVNLTLGGLQPMWSGAPLFCELRYFDSVNRRPGLPEDTAALVTSIKPQTVTVTLINICQTEPREVIVQTGGCAEHRCEKVEINGRFYSVNKRFFTVRLAPGAGAELVIHRTRFANEPTFAFPWHGDRVPLWND